MIFKENWRPQMGADALSLLHIRRPTSAVLTPLKISEMCHFYCILPLKPGGELKHYIVLKRHSSKNMHFDRHFRMLKVIKEK